MTILPYIRDETEVSSKTYLMQGQLDMAHYIRAICMRARMKMEIYEPVEYGALHQSHGGESAD